MADVYCVSCGCYMGWQYVDAEDADQKYKIGEAGLAAPFTPLLNLTRSAELLASFGFPGKSVLEMAKLEKITRESDVQAEL